MKRIVLCAVTAGLMLSLLAGCGRSSSTDGLLSDFTSTDLDGNEVDSTIFSDYDLTLVNVWGTFCPNCLPEMTALSELAEEYADQGVQIVGIVGDIRYSTGQRMEDKIQTARDLVEETGATNYTHILPSESLKEAILNDLQGFPTTFFVDGNGVQVGKTILLARDKDTWAKFIEQRLAQVTDE